MSADTAALVFPAYAFDFEPRGNGGNEFAEVYETHNGETLFYCVTDAVASKLAFLLSGSPR